MTIKPNSEILIDTFQQEKISASGKLSEMETEVSPSNIKINLNYGELINRVRRLNKSSQYQVRTPHGVSGIRGTNIRMTVSSDQTQLSVLDGHVDCFNEKEGYIGVGNGKTLDIESSGLEIGAIDQATQSIMDEAINMSSGLSANVTLSSLATVVSSVQSAGSTEAPTTAGLGPNLFINGSFE